MQRIKFSLLLLLVIGLLACDNDDSLDNLQGSWRVSSAFVDGSGSSASGTVRFGGTNASEINLRYEVANDTIYRNGTMSYSQTEDEVIIELDNESLVWTRRVNKRDEQEFEFTEKIDQVSYGVVLDMVPE